ncbi:MAG: hypothetical protein U9Q74_16830, partial [Gemmatimonadota bacterium]|nr:hypothetical protein [Gemmatimonadota bacterium]
MNRISPRQVIHDWRATDLSITARTGQAITLARADAVARIASKAGIWSAVPNGLVRFGYYGSEFGALFESGYNQNALGSNLFGDATYWGWNTPFTVAAMTSAIGGQVATKHTDSAGGSHYRSQGIGTFVNAQADCSWMLLENVDATESMIGIFDGSASAFLAAAKLTWSGLATAADQGTAPSGYGVINLGTGPNGGQLALLWVTGTGT